MRIRTVMACVILWFFGWAFILPQFESITGIKPGDSLVTFVILIVMFVSLWLFLHVVHAINQRNEKFEREYPRDEEIKKN